MILVTGGAFQGKHEFAREKLNITSGWVDGDTCSYNDIFKCRGVMHFHRFVRHALEKNKSVDGLVEKLMDVNPDICIVTNELGSGVVPVEQFNRKYRDALGKVCIEIAAASSEVYRVICGIGVIIKKENAPERY